MLVDGNATPVVTDACATVCEQRDVDPRAVTGHRFVDGVVDDFADEFVESLETGGADVHSRSLANRFQTLENLNVLGRVATGFHSVFAACAVTIGLRRARG